MKTNPLPFTLLPSKRKILLFSALSGGLCVLGLIGLSNDEPLGWLFVVLFGSLVPLFLVQALPKSSDFTVSEDGIEFYTVFWKQQYQWSEIKCFSVCTAGQHGIPVREKVGFDLLPNCTKLPLLRKVQKWRSGYERILPDDYGFRADDLARLLADYHELYKAETTA